MVEAILLVNNPVGLHARPAALFVQAAKKFTAEISVRNLNGGERVSNAKTSSAC